MVFSQYEIVAPFGLALPAARLLEDGDGSEGEGGEGGTVTTTVETSFDVLKFIQRYIYMYMPVYI